MSCRLPRRRRTRGRLSFSRSLTQSVRKCRRRRSPFRRLTRTASRSTRSCSASRSPRMRRPRQWLTTARRWCSCRKPSSSGGPTSARVFSNCRCSTPSTVRCGSTRSGCRSSRSTTTSATSLDLTGARPVTAAWISRRLELLWIRHIRRRRRSKSRCQQLPLSPRRT